jgi:hypothetical protein
MMATDDVLTEGETLLFEPCAGEPLRKRAFASWAMQHGATLIRIVRAAQKIREHHNQGLPVYPWHPLATELDAALDALGDP